MNRTRWILLGGLLLISAFLALPLLDVVDTLVIAPIAYLLWGFGIIYSLIPQPVFWVLLVLAVLYVAVSTLYDDIPIFTNRKRKRLPADGSIASLSKWMQKGQRGVYYKWQTANMLARMALEMASLRAGRPLRRLDWSLLPPASDEIRAYLEAGLNRTFADFQVPGWFGPAPKTALDVDVNDVLKYLETNMEMENG